MGETGIKIGILFLFFTWTVSISVVKAIQPYPVLRNSESEVGQEPELSCDAHCYKNRFMEPRSNISFVCATDGVTYLNLEEMSCVRTSCRKDIRLWSYGKCPRSGRREEMDTNFLQFLSQISQKPQTQLAYPKVQEQKSEESSFSPWSSESEPNYESSGKIPPSVIKIMKFPSQFRKVKKVCLPDECGCPQELQPICGSDSVTYGNECLMKCNKLCDPDIIKYHDGHCGKLFFKQSCVPDECGCPDDQKPVCGSDHVTYGNKCLLECNKNCNPDVIYHHDGYCGRLFFPKTTATNQFQ